MAVRIQVPKKAAFVRFMLNPWGRAFLIIFLVVNTTALAAFLFYYTKYSKLIEQKLLAGPFTNTSMLFAAPEVVMVGDTDHAGRYCFRSASKRLCGFPRQRPHGLV